MTEWSDQPDVAEPAATVEIDRALAVAVAELEQYAAQTGWDQPARLFALVDTEQLLADEPGFASALGIEAGAEGLTAIEQEELPEADLEETLVAIEWPEEVHGCAVIVERFVLPPAAEDAVPDDPAAAREFAAAHPDHQEVRIVAAATRRSTTYCALRVRSHDDDLSVIAGPAVVPTLLELLLSTFRTDSPE